MRTSTTFKLKGTTYHVIQRGINAVDVETREHMVPCRVFLGSYDGLNLVPTRKYRNSDACLRASIEIALMEMPACDSDVFFVDDTSEMEEAFAELMS